jgi:hypothetical protein
MILRPLLLSAVLAVMPVMADQAFAQGAPQAVARIDVKQLATGYRASKIVGATVYNQANQSVGKVDDLIVSPEDRVFYAVLSIGGFLGVGSHLVAVPYSTLQVSADGSAGNRFVLPGATKDQLKAMPEFKYAAR